MSSIPPIVLSFAASDPTAGAGAQADLLTLAAMGCHPLSVLTGFTVQDTRGVEALRPLEAAWVERQARVLLEDIPVAAFKLGVLGSRENALAIAALLAEHPGVPVVLDPVLASGRGDALADETLIDALRTRLLPLATVVTPNSLELRRLAGATEDDGEATDAVLAQRLLAQGCAHVLVTGTDAASEDVVNRLFTTEGLLRADRWPRLPDAYHGSGCTLAAAIAAALANGRSVPEAVHDAQDYTWQALAAGFRPGAGQWLPDRLFWARGGAATAATGEPLP